MIIKHLTLNKMNIENCKFNVEQCSDNDVNFNNEVWTVIIANWTLSYEHLCIDYQLFWRLFIKLDGVGPVNNRPSTE